MGSFESRELGEWMELCVSEAFMAAGCCFNTERLNEKLKAAFKSAHTVFRVVSLMLW